MISVSQSQAFRDAILVANAPVDRFSERERRMARFILDSRNGTPARQLARPANRFLPDDDGPRAA